MPLLLNICLAFQSGHTNLRKASLFTRSSSSHDSMEENDTNLSTNESITMESLSRREMLTTIATITVFSPLAAQALTNDKVKSLEDVKIGTGSWTALGSAERSKVGYRDVTVPPSFATYVARILINYDEGVASWWLDLNHSYSLLSPEEKRNKLGAGFGNFAASLQRALGNFVKNQNDSEQAWGQLFDIFIVKYGNEDDAVRQILILFSVLPKNKQPTAKMKQIFNRYKTTIQPETSLSSTTESLLLPETWTTDNLDALLPNGYGCIPNTDDSGFVISPRLNLYEFGVDEEFGQAVTATLFGPLSSAALTRGLPKYSFDVYALFGISGATGCALTHSVVIPLDVVKTKAQTDPEDYANIVSGASRILKEEGVQGLLTGAQATLAGYFWYGLSVYPSYTFFKRTIGQALFPPEFSILHANDIALIAGALAAVIASLGLTPLEAARIRVVADPEQYKPLGLVGTLDVIANEDKEVGWKAVYAGLPSLMTRQVIFGSVKFLAFERACEAIYITWPFLRDATWTALAVSLVAGGFSGALSSVVSQPADAVLTYVAQKNDSGRALGVIEGCQLMVEESGISSLFRGLGSRSLWAASIIAGQFLLYDIFRNYLGVAADDLMQIYDIKIE